MNHLFSQDGFVMKGLTKFFDAIVLNIVFMLVCLPLITIGPAVTALYYSTVKNMRRNRSYALKEFFHSFRRDFKQSLILEIILLIVGLILYVDIRMSVEGTNILINSIRYLYVIIGVIFVFIAIYAFPLISRFSLSMKELLKLSLFLSIRHLLTTVVSGILLFGCFAFAYITFGAGLFLAPVITIYLISIMMEKILKQCMDLVQNQEKTGNADEWYME